MSLFGDNPFRNPQPLPEKKMDPVDPKELKGKHADRTDKDIDNDGDVDSSDKFLHKKRKAITKNIKKDDDEAGNDDAIKEEEVDVKESAFKKPKPDPKRFDKTINKLTSKGGPFDKVMGPKPGQKGKRLKPMTMGGMRNEENEYGIGYNKKSVNHADKGIASLKKSNLKVNHIGNSEHDSGNTQGSKPHSKPDVTIHYERGDKPHRDSPSGATYHTAAAKNHDSHKHLQNADKHGIFEAADLDDKNVEKAMKHDCATHVTHEEHGAGECIPGMHTLVPANEEMEEWEATVSHYDVMFEGSDGKPFIVENVPVQELKIDKSESHMHKRKK